LELKVEKRKKLEHLKLTYIKLFKQYGAKINQFEDAIIQKKNDQVMVVKVYLWIILSLKFTFNILLSHKNDLQQNWIRIYECLQEMLFNHRYKIVYII